MANSSSFYQETNLAPVTEQYGTQQILALIEATSPNALKEWLASLPVYSGTGPVPVASGEWFISNGILTQAS